MSTDTWGRQATRLEDVRRTEVLPQVLGDRTSVHLATLGAGMIIDARNASLSPPGISLPGSMKNTGASGTRIPGPCRASPATVTPRCSRPRPRDAGVPCVVGLRASGLEHERSRSAFGRVRQVRGRSSASEHVVLGAVWRMHRTVWRLARRIRRTGPERSPPQLHLVGRRNDVRPVTGQIRFGCDPSPRGASFPWSPRTGATSLAHLLSWRTARSPPDPHTSRIHLRADRHRCRTPRSRHWCSRPIR